MSYSYSEDCCDVVPVKYTFYSTSKFCVPKKQHGLFALIRYDVSLLALKSSEFRKTSNNLCNMEYLPCDKRYKNT